jgi:hypothetical protein
VIGRFRFDNATGDLRPLSETHSMTTAIEAPRGLRTTPGSYVAVEISADSEEHRAWGKPIRAVFRQTANDWKLVGLERLPASPSSGAHNQTRDH